MPQQKQPLLITIDTEGDNLWARPSSVTTNNAHFIPRFQSLCEEFGFRPTYFVAREMCESPDFLSFGLKLLQNRSGEIGTHLHAWDTPPIVPLTEDDNLHAPYLTSYTKEVIFEKLSYMTNLISDRFGIRPTSHRAGRWAISNVYLEALQSLGYLVDSSVTPGIDWRGCYGGEEAGAAPNYRKCTNIPQLILPSTSGKIGLWEVPTTILARTKLGSVLDPLSQLLPRQVRFLEQLFRLRLWLRPGYSSANEMKIILNQARQDRFPCVVLSLHSSELMPGGSPTFKTAQSIEQLYCDLRVVFKYAGAHFKGYTMTEFVRDLK